MRLDTLVRFDYKGRHFKIVVMPARRSSQLTLDLRSKPAWGGRRPNAGRPPKGKQAELRHASRAAFRKLPAHVTVRVRPDVPSLRTVSVVHEVERSIAKACARPGFRLVHYSLQDTHAHFVVEAVDRRALGRGMMALASRLARAVNRVTEHTGPVFSDRYHSRLLKTPRECHRALRYVLLNARHHARAHAGRTRVALDPASSARWFDGWKTDPTAANERASAGAGLASPVAAPTTWLLARGWRRHGLLDPTDVPG